MIFQRLSKELLNASSFNSAIKDSQRLLNIYKITNDKDYAVFYKPFFNRFFRKYTKKNICKYFLKEIDNLKPSLEFRY